jgi:hypothetical protein
VWRPTATDTDDDMTTTTTAPSVGDLRTLIPDFERSLRARNMAPKTVRLYREAALSMVAFFLAQGMPTEVTKIRREHVEHYINDQIAKWAPATANQRYRSLAALWSWLGEEGEIRTSPAAKMRPPRVPEQLVPVVLSEARSIIGIPPLATPASFTAPPTTEADLIAQGEQRAPEPTRPPGHPATREHRRRLHAGRPRTPPRRPPGRRLLRLRRAGPPQAGPAARRLTGSLPPGLPGT